MWLVLVNGEAVIEAGQFTGKRPGKVLRRVAAGFKRSAGHCRPTP
jgi:hypothetical protein